MRTMHWVARLESYDSAPTETRELGAQICRCDPKRPKIVMGGQLQSFYATAHVPVVRSVEKIIHSGMHRARRAQNSLRFSLAIRLPDIFDMQHGQHYALGITQRDLGAPRLERFRKCLRHIERNRHRPNQTVAQSHLVADALVIVAIHKTAQW